jgi:glycosyltransferase involved in cell wall biosynthesis
MDSVGERTGRAIHVGVNAHLLSLARSYRSAGINWYIYNLLRHLPQVASDIEYTVFLNERRYTVAPGIRLCVSRLPTGRPQTRILWEQGLQPRALRRAKVDLLHSPAFVGPLSSACPFVLTVHDLSYLFFPQGFRALNRSYLQTFTRLSVRRARRVIAVSESTKRDLVEQYDLSPGKVDVVHNGVDPGFQPLPVGQVAAFRREKGLPDRFILFVGTLEPRKNVVGLVEAYARLPKDRPPLILVGGKGWLYDEIFTRVEALGLAGEVRFVGYVPAEVLPLWYSAADLFVYPSLYEGFGLPPLEAMACGTAVISSTASSLPEVVGEAGLLIDPADTEALAKAMEQVLSDTEMRKQMQSAGLVQAQNFSWERTARQTIESYRRALTPDGGKKGV